MRVEVPRDGGWHEVARTPATLPLQRDLRALRAGLAAESFRATWTGTFLAARSGLHQFNVASDDGSRVWIDDTLVVDNSGRHARQWRSGLVTLAAGPHVVRIEYEQWGGDAHLETWLRQPGGLSQRLDAVRRQFAPGPVTRVERAARTLRGWLPWVAVSAGCAAYGALLLAAGLALFRRIERLASVPPATWHLALALTLAAVPIATGLLWGLPADADGWAPDELTPTRLVRGGGGALRRAVDVDLSAAAVRRAVAAHARGELAGDRGWLVRRDLSGLVRPARRDARGLGADGRWRPGVALPAGAPARHRCPGHRGRRRWSVVQHAPLLRQDRERGRAVPLLGVVRLRVRRGRRSHVVGAAGGDGRRGRGLRDWHQGPGGGLPAADAGLAGGHPLA